MAHVTADRVKETSITTGTGALTLAGAVTAFQAFSAVCADTDTAYYCATLDSAAQWEVGLGTWGTGNILARTTVLASSNAGAAVNFSPGAKTVFLTIPAAIIKPRREVLTANRTYYVRTDGSDSNTGLANTAGGAWLNPSKAYDYVSSNLDLGGQYKVSVFLGAGTHSGISIATNGGGILNGLLEFVSDEAAVSGVVIGVCSFNNIGPRSQIKFIYMTFDANSDLVKAGNDNVVILSQCAFAAQAGNSVLTASAGGRIEVSGSITVSGTQCARFANLLQRGTLYVDVSSTNFLSAFNFTVAGLKLSEGSMVEYWSHGALTGTVTGVRANAKHLSQIITATGVEATDLLGNAAGTYTTGAQIVAA